MASGERRNFSRGGDVFSKKFLKLSRTFFWVDQLDFSNSPKHYKDPILSKFFCAAGKIFKKKRRRRLYKNFKVDQPKTDVVKF